MTLDQFIETAIRVKPEWDACRLPSGWYITVLPKRDGIKIDLSDDRASAEFRQVLEEDLERMGYEAHAYWRRSSGGWVYNGARGEDSRANGEGPTKTEAIVMAWIQANEEAGS